MTGPISGLIQAALHIRAVLMAANVDLEGAEVVIRLKRPQHVEHMRCAVRADPMIFTETQPHPSRWPFAGLQFRFEEVSRGHCVEGDRCVCGGDLSRIREGCSNWRTP